MLPSDNITLAASNLELEVPEVVELVPHPVHHEVEAEVWDVQVVTQAAHNLTQQDAQRPAQQPHFQICFHLENKQWIRILNFSNQK